MTAPLTNMDYHPAVFPYIQSESKVQKVKNRIMEVLDKEREYRRRGRALIRQYNYGEDQRFDPHQDRHRGRFTTNLTFAYVRTIVPSAAFRAPKVVVNADEPEAEAGAPILEAVINRELENTDAEGQFRKALLYACILARGYCKVGYHTEFGIRPEIIDPRKKKIPNSGGRKYEVEFDEYILDERAFIKHVPTFNIVRDPMVDRIHEGRWMAERFVRPLDTLRKDRRFINTDKLRPTTAFMGQDDFAETDWHWNTEYIDSAIWNRKSRPENVDNPIEYYCWWSKEDGKVYTVAEGVDDWIMPPRDWEIDVGGFPVEELFLYDVPEDNMGTSVVEQLAWHQYEINSIRRFQVDCVKRQNPKLAIAKNSDISKDQIDALKRGITMAIVESNDPTRDFAQIPQPAMSADNYRVLGELMGDMDLISGISKPNLGGQVAGATRRTATENMREQAGFQVRIDDIVREIERFGTKCAEKLAAIITTMYDTEDVIRIAGQRGAQFIPFIGTGLAGRYRFSTEMGSTTPGNEAIRKKQILDALTIFSSPDLAQYVNIQELVKRALKQFPELGRDIENLLMGPQQQMQEALEQQLVTTMAGQDGSAEQAAAIAQGQMAAAPMPEGGGEEGGAGVNGLRQGTEVGSEGLEGLVSRANRLTQ